MIYINVCLDKEKFAITLACIILNKKHTQGWLFIEIICNLFSDILQTSFRYVKITWIIRKIRKLVWWLLIPDTFLVNAALSMCLQSRMKKKSRAYDVTHDIPTNIYKKMRRTERR